MIHSPFLHFYEPFRAFSKPSSSSHHLLKSDIVSSKASSTPKTCLVTKLVSLLQFLPHAEDLHMSALPVLCQWNIFWLSQSVSTHQCAIESLLLLSAVSLPRRKASIDISQSSICQHDQLSLPEQSAASIFQHGPSQLGTE